MSSIIKVENLGKKYFIRHEHPERYTALRDVISQGAKKIFSFPSKLRPNKPSSEYEDFWALKDLNFEIQQGDRVGIIGRNGAGKSTLLKILSRITEPSTGRIELNGRVASLLEVGTGFHPELSGRENIFLNGAILGMSRYEIKSKFDEIVDFSGVENFLDTPVKRYSSGMYVRLAFAVAAHLEPEILVVDEVLAVGDAEFQKKCLGKMEDVSKKDGRTVLFVSHNINSLLSLCVSGLLLEKGQIVESGEIEKVAHSYISTSKSKLTQQANDINSSNFGFTINNLSVEQPQFNVGDNIQISISISYSGKLTDLSLLIYNSKMERVAILDLRNIESVGSAEHYEAVVIFKNNRLIEGHYSLGLFYSTTLSSQNIFDIISFNILANEKSSFIKYPVNVRGYFEPEFQIK